MKPPLLNIDRRGLPKDYASYVWLLYRRHVEDRSPERLAFLHGPSGGDWPNHHVQIVKLALTGGDK